MSYLIRKESAKLFPKPDPATKEACQRAVQTLTTAVLAPVLPPDLLG